MASIEEITFDCSKMEQARTEQYEKCWFDHNTQTQITLHFFDKEPDIPCKLSDIESLRNSFRDGITQVGGGLIKLDLVQLDSVDGIESIFKVPQNPHGMTYICALTLPFSRFSYVIKVVAAESGITGLRDNAVLGVMLGEGKIQIEKNGQISGWASDPYMPSWQARCLRNESDDEKYDEQFPDHPLSRLRKIINQIKRTTTFANGVKSEPRFAK